MKRSLYMPLWIFSMVFFSACHGSPRASESVAQGKGAISGVVTLSGESDFSASLVALSGSNADLTTSTDANGKFTINAVPYGEYTLRMSSPTFKALEMHVIVSAPFLSMGMFELSSRAVAVSGTAFVETLRDHELWLLGGHHLRFTRTHSRRGLELGSRDFFTSRTAANGTFTSELEAGRYEIHVGNSADGVFTRLGSFSITGLNVAEAVGEFVLPHPEGIFRIFGTTPMGPSQMYTNIPQIELKSQRSGTASVRLGYGTADFCDAGGAQPWAPVIQWTLGSEGIWDLCAILITSDGTVLPTHSARMVYDAQGPNLQSISFSGEAFATSVTLPVYFSVSDSYSGVARVALSEFPADLTSMATAGSSYGSLVLSAGDGQKQIFAMAWDYAGNASQMVSNLIHLDTNAPIAQTVRIVDGNGFTVAATNTSTVRVAMQASDFYPVEVQFSERDDFYGATWHYYSAFDWAYFTPSTHPSGQMRTVYARVKDLAGHVVSAGSASVLVDTVAPSIPAIVIQGLANDVTNVTPVVVSATATGALQRQLSLNSNFTGAQWESYSSVPVTFPVPYDGFQQVYARFRDSVGNVSTTVWDSLTLDREPPTIFATLLKYGSLPVTITNQKDLTLQVDGYGYNAVYARVSTHPAFVGASWVPYVSTYPVSLTVPTNPNGEIRWVYVQMRDTIGNLSPTTATAVTLDTIAPSLLSAVINYGNAVTNSNLVPIQVTAENCDFVRLSEDASFSGSSYYPCSPGPTTWSLSVGAGFKTVYYRLSDLAGNMTFGSLSIELQY